MIIRILDNELYNKKIIASDWRYSAAALGIYRFFKFLKNTKENVNFLIEDDFIKYNDLYFTKENYLMFVENYFRDYMHHLEIENILENSELNEDEIKIINEKLKANSIMKKIFNQVKFEKNLKDEILNKINENRFEIIEETYKNGNNLYKKFIGPSLFFQKESEICRLNGYYEDKGRKIKTNSFKFNKDSFVFEDCFEFDFIPFAFSKTEEGFFINNNISIESLYNSNNIDIIDEKDSKKKRDIRKNIFSKHKKSSNYLDYDVEIIIKNVKSDFFEILLLNKNARNVFDNLSQSQYELIMRFIKIKEDDYLNIEQEVTNNILRNIKLDYLIEKLFKYSNDSKINFNDSLLMEILIKINQLMCGGINLDMYNVKKTAEEMCGYLIKNNRKNKISTYKNRLLNNVILKDYDSFKETILQLASYAGGKPISFAYKLFEDFETNKNLAYAFINALDENFKNKEND